MPCTSCGTVHAAGTPCPTGAGVATLTAAPPAQAAPPAVETVTAQLASAIQAAFAQATAGLAPQLAAQLGLSPLAGPEVVPSSTPGQATYMSVSEPSVYTFVPGHGPSIVRDLFHARTGNPGDKDVREAGERLGKFALQQADFAAKFHAAGGERALAAQFATGTRAGISQIIPPGYRPDMYVPQLFQGRPLTEMLSRGVIENANPFSIPKFGTSTGLSGTGTEGTNPTDGTLTMGTQTVTPTTAVGLFKITRELVDVSNPAIDAIAVQAMQEAYSQDTEGRVYALLNGASGVGGTITSGAVPSGAIVLAQAAGGTLGSNADEGALLLDDIRQQLLAYPFRRFAPLDRMALSQEATLALGAAKDSTGRPLLPVITPMNAVGTVSGAGTPTQAFNIDGLVAQPTWSMTGNTAGDADTIGFNHNDAWAWESGLLMFRYEERSGPALVELAMFGYFAAAVLRASGFSAIRLTVS